MNDIFEIILSKNPLTGFDLPKLALKKTRRRLQIILLKVRESLKTFSSQAVVYFGHEIQDSPTRPQGPHQTESLPLPLVNFKDYLLTVPEVADGIPQGLARFFMQLVVPKDNNGIVATITETMEPINTEKNVLPFILDIDVYQNINLAPTDKIIWETFGELREYKNLIFKKSITPKCEEHFR